MFCVRIRTVKLLESADNTNGGKAVNAILNHEENSIEIKDFEHNKKRAEAGDPNNTAFILRVESAVGFVGTSRYICDIGGFRRFISELDELFKKRIISAKLVDQSLGSYITFKMSGRDIFIVKGMSLGSDGEHILKYEFGIERSDIFAFIKQLREIVGEYYGISAS